jgi:translation initiation factor IF-2
MSELETIRLNKVLRELNISLDRAVEHLKEKGHEIEARPTTKISGEVHQVLLDEFQTDMSKKAASLEVSEEKRKEKEAFLQQIEKEQEEKRQAKEKKDNELIKAKSNLLKPKTVGKIDLEPKKADPAPTPAITPVTVIVPAPAPAPLPVEETVQVVAVEKPETPTETPEIQKVNTVVEAEVQITEVVEKGKEVLEEPKVEEAVSDQFKTQYQKLSGPKLTGATIDLSQFEKKKKEPAAGSAAQNADRKRKRKRILNDKNDANQRNQVAAKGKQQPQTVRAEPSDEEVQRQVRETLEKLQGKSSKGKGAKYRREKRDLHKQQSDKELEQQELDSKILKVTEYVTVNEVATMMDVLLRRLSRPVCHWE